MTDQICRNCSHYMQHYAFNDKGLFRVFCGHCKLRNGRKKQPDKPACAKFLAGPKDTDSFVRKEYLSKELLQYLLRLELLPENIEDLPHNP